MSPKPPQSGGFERIERGRLQDWRPLLGRKVSIRYRLHGDPDVALSEAIGVVQSVTGSASGDEHIAILNRKGEVRSVPVVDILAGKVWQATRSENEI